MMVAFIFSILISSLTGYYFLRVFGLRLESPLLQICLSIIFGLGISSLVYFLLMWFTIERFPMVLVEASLCFLLFGIVKYKKYLPKGSSISPWLSTVASKNRLQNILMFILLIVSTVIAVTLIILVLQNKHGNWDAWAIWNLRARYFYRSGLDWQNNYASLKSWSHPDYPLFLPLTVTRLWLYIGQETTLVPILMSVLFFATTIMTIYASLTFMRGKLFGIIGTLLLIGSPFFVLQGTAQYADIPLSLFFLTAWILMALHDQNKSTAILVLVGISLGLTTWIKNEGMLFSAIFLIVFFITSWLNHRHLQSAKLYALLSGFFIVFVFTLSFKLTLAPKNDLISEQNTASILANLQDVSRYRLAGNAFFESARNLFQVPLIIFPALLIFFGIDKQRVKKPVVRIAVSTLISMLIAYFFIYINTPYDIEWHLKTSLARLYLQLWPSFVFVTLFMVQDFNFKWNSTARNLR